MKEKQKILREYPSILLNTLFHEYEKYEKYRKVEFSNVYFFSDDVKSMGNQAYQNCNYYQALDYYEYVTLIYFLLIISV